MFLTLDKIAKKLNQHNVRWVIGGSLLLSHFNLCDIVNDIDLIIDTKDNKLANQLIKEMSSKEIKRESKIFVSDFFNEYIVDGVSIDVISGFKIKNSKGIYEYDFSEEAIGKKIMISGSSISLARIEDWYVIYSLIPNKEEKLLEIEKYFSKEYPNKSRLRQCLSSNLPSEVEEKIKRYL